MASAENVVGGDDVGEITHDNLARVLFGADPKEECSVDISLDEVDTAYVFELLLNLLFEGLDIVYGGLNNVDIGKINGDRILALNPWFKSVKFRVVVDEFNRKDVGMYDDYYCRVYLRKMNQVLFEVKKFKKSFHFILNGKNMHNFDGLFDLTRLGELKAVFAVGEVVLVISFRYYLGDGGCKM